MHEDALQRQVVHSAVGAVGVADAVYFAAFGRDFLRSGVGNDADVVTFAELFDQHFVRFEFGHEFHQGHAFDDAGQVQRGLNAGIAATDNGDVFVFEEGAVAVRAEGDAVADVFFFTGDAEFAPFRAACHDKGAGFDGLAGVEGDFMGFVSRRDAFHAEVFTDGDRVGSEMAMQFARKFGARGFRHRDEVFDVHGVFDLTTDAVGNDGDAEAFARGVDGGG